jgi:hypothetical protein
VGNTLDQIRRENQVINQGLSNVSVFTFATVICAAITLAAVVTVTVIQPSNASITSTIIGIMTPVTLGFLGAAIHGIYKGVDGRFSQLIEHTANKVEKETMSDVIRTLNNQLSKFEVGSPEYLTIIDQIRVEAVKKFDAGNRRLSDVTDRRQPKVENDVSR